MKEIAIMTGAKKYERIIERKQKERKLWNEKQHGMSTRKKI